MMDHPLLPWWVILLLGMWSVALTVWQHPAVSREPRIWSGVLALIYLLLIFLALGMGFPAQLQSPSLLARISLDTVALFACFLGALIAAVWMLGRISIRGRQLCYLVITLLNAGICALLQCVECALVLLLVAFIIAIRTRDQRPSIETVKQAIRDLGRFTVETVAPEETGESWLLGMTSAFIGCLLLGTLAYALRHELADTTTNPQQSVLPAPAELAAVLANSSGRSGEVSLLQVAAGRRADIVVLMAITVFLALAISQRDLNREPPTPTQSDPVHSSGPPYDE